MLKTLIESLPLHLQTKQSPQKVMTQNKHHIISFCCLHINIIISESQKKKQIVTAEKMGKRTVVINRSSYLTITVKGDAITSD
jgi:hypothetical protein